jgi:hypothetical protein
MLRARCGGDCTARKHSTMVWVRRNFRNPETRKPRNARAFGFNMAVREGFEPLRWNLHAAGGRAAPGFWFLGVVLHGVERPWFCPKIALKFRDVLRCSRADPEAAGDVCGCPPD